MDNLEGTTDCLYFAFGSMMNPISLEGRQLNPIKSVPAELLNFRLGFFGSMGFASTRALEGASCHGVLHRMTDEDMKKLDKIEITYDRVKA